MKKKIILNCMYMEKTPHFLKIKSNLIHFWFFG